MSRLELKQTWPFALQMSAFDPKRTSGHIDGLYKALDPTASRFQWALNSACNRCVGSSAVKETPSTFNARAETVARHQ